MTFPVAAGRAAFFALLVLVTYLSLAPSPPDAPSGIAATRMIAEFLLGDAAHADKIGHFAAYAALGAVAHVARVFRSSYWCAPLALAAYGAGLEGGQYFLDARSADGLDVLANAAGAVVGFATATIAERAAFPAK